MPLIRARHEVFGVCEVPDTDTYLDNGWTPVDESTPTADEERRAAVLAAGAYDPAEHPLDGPGGVIAYLAQADDEERARVIAAELGRGDKARKGVTDWSE